MTIGGSRITALTVSGHCNHELSSLVCIVAGSSIHVWLDSCAYFSEGTPKLDCKRFIEVFSHKVALLRLCGVVGWLAFVRVSDTWCDLHYALESTGSISTVLILKAALPCLTKKKNKAAHLVTSFCEREVSVLFSSFPTPEGVLIGLLLLFTRKGSSSNMHSLWW
jgi:hypothetical protein